MIDDRIFQLAAGTGVIHVGANLGQERDAYERHGMRVLWFEPLPESYEVLCENIRHLPSQTAFRLAIMDKEGTFPFHVTDNEGQSSSVYPLKLHREVWPNVHEVRTTSVDAITLDGFWGSSYNSGALRPQDYRILMIDVQGAEIEALRGATATLGHMRFVELEVMDFEAYEGQETRLAQVEAFLTEHGFREFQRACWAPKVHEIVYENQNSPA